MIKKPRRRLSNHASKLIKNLLAVAFNYAPEDIVLRDPDARRAEKQLREYIRFLENKGYPE